ncbi:MAG: SDR family oxidoreductase [Variovorax sp.]|nr:MAG: SDR family oxidoreductase [Variovorax sp.]
MNGRLAGKVCIVVGAGSVSEGWGNGKATSVLFAREGAVLHLVDRNASALEETLELVRAEGGSATSSVADVESAQAPARLVADCVAAHGRVDVLHHNVGIAVPGGVMTVGLADWDRAFRVNLTSVLLAARAAAPHMAAQGGGSIVATSSISGLRVTSGLSFVSYPSSKAALNHLVRAMAVELAKDGIRCNLVVPGFIHTPMVEHSVLASQQDPQGTLTDYLQRRLERIPLGRWGEAWDVAKAALFLASDDSRYITGLEMVVDGGASLLTG